MLISELLATPDLEPALRGLKVSGLTADSRMARSGFAFFAIPGHAGDGLSYVADAKSRGACVVVAQRRADSPLPLVVVDDVRRALALAAARFFSRQPSTIAAVTGTMLYVGSQQSLCGAFEMEFHEKTSGKGVCGR